MHRFETPSSTVRRTTAATENRPSTREETLILIAAAALRAASGSIPLCRLPTRNLRKQISPAVSRASVDVVLSGYTIARSMNKRAAHLRRYSTCVGAIFIRDVTVWCPFFAALDIGTAARDLVCKLNEYLFAEISRNSLKNNMSRTVNFKCESYKEFAILNA